MCVYACVYRQMNARLPRRALYLGSPTTNQAEQILQVSIAPERPPVTRTRLRCYFITTVSLIDHVSPATASVAYPGITPPSHNVRALSVRDLSLYCKIAQSGDFVLHLAVVI